MKERTISLAEARQLLDSWPAQFSEECPTMIVSCNNQPVLTLMSYKAHQALLKNIESLQTMLEIMSGSETIKVAPRKPKKKKNAHSTSWEEFQSEVGWE